MSPFARDFFSAAFMRRISTRDSVPTIADHRRWLRLPCVARRHALPSYLATRQCCVRLHHPLTRDAKGCPSFRDLIYYVRVLHARQDLSLGGWRGFLAFRSAVYVLLVSSLGVRELGKSERSIETQSRVLSPGARSSDRLGDDARISGFRLQAFAYSGGCSLHPHTRWRRRPREAPQNRCEHSCCGEPLCDTAKALSLNGRRRWLTNEANSHANDTHGTLEPAEGGLLPSHR
jgi:hypothetical protein